MMKIMSNEQELNEVHGETQNLGHSFSQIIQLRLDHLKVHSVHSRSRSRPMKENEYQWVASEWMVIFMRESIRII